MAKIFAILGAIKEAISIFKILSNLYKKYKHNKIDKHYEEKQNRRDDLVSKISLEVEKGEPSDAILRDLHSLLRNLES